MREGPTTQVISASPVPAIRHALALFAALVPAHAVALVLAYACHGAAGQVSPLAVLSQALTTTTPLVVLFGAIVHARRITKRGPVVPLCFLAGALHVTSQAVVTWTWNHELGVPAWLGPPPVTPIDEVLSRIFGSLASPATLVNALMFGLGFAFAAYGPRPLGATLLLAPWAASGIVEWARHLDQIPRHASLPWAPFRPAVYIATTVAVASILFPLLDRISSRPSSRT